MSVDGCGPVRWDIWSVGGYKAKARRGKNGHAEHDSDPMAGEISPDIMFGKKTKKNAQTTLDGSMWVPMGAMGHRDMEEQENKRKRDTYCANGVMLCMCVQATEKQQNNNDENSHQRGQREQMSGNLGVCRACTYI